MASRWTTADIPRQDGLTAIVTGANSGIGLVAARELVRAGAHVVLACRNLEKGQAALAAITAVAGGGGGSAELAALDLSDLSSVAAFASGLKIERLDLLVNNAGVMAPPKELTTDGFELQFGTNHLGHFALTGRLLGRLLAAPAARVVTVSSSVHRIGKIHFGDLQWEKRYHRWPAYGQSKLANLMFALELQRRSDAADLKLLSLAVHPGYAATNLQTASTSNPLEKIGMQIGNVVFAQSGESGALPTLYAATEPDVPGGAFIGPDGPGEMRGSPRIVTAKRQAYDEAVARRLWEVSEELTKVRFAFPTPAPA
jgi:NAD(P)-dependent dehydrogenase (short-subunit alcohol dehydrogenase family)